MSEIATIEGYLYSLQKSIAELPKHKIPKIIELILSTYKADRQIFFFGNGGSAATASHFACDLGKGPIFPDKKRFRVISLCDQIPMITAWANDFDAPHLFAHLQNNKIGYVSSLYRQSIFTSKVKYLHFLPKHNMVVNYLNLKNYE